MKSKEFLIEVQESSIKPDNFEEIYNSFKDFQNLIMETLNEFHRVCEKNYIRYQLAYGSLLGMIRDGGQIPWDYDVDVFVPCEDRNNLIKALEKDLSDNYYFACFEINKSFSSVIMRVAPKGYDTACLHVDVFFLSGLPKDRKAALKHQKSLARTALLIRSKTFDKKAWMRASNREKLYMLYFKYVIGIFTSLDIAREQYTALALRYNIDKSDYCCSADRFAGWYQFPTSMVKDTILYSTEHGVFRVPSNYEEILRIKYGDYYSIPPLEQRLSELLRHYHFLKINS